jgi:DNA-binding Lrp family transcriptional regulator
MSTAFSLIRTESGKETEVLEALLTNDHITSAFIVLGRYDIIARVQSESIEEARSILLNDIRKIPHILETMTLIVVEGKDK